MRHFYFISAKDETEDILKGFEASDVVLLIPEGRDISDRERVVIAREIHDELGAR